MKHEPAARTARSDTSAQRVGGLVILPSSAEVQTRDVRENTPFPAQALASLGLAEEIGMRQLTMLQLWLPVVDTVYAAGLELMAIQVVQRPRKAA
ncbi:MAG: hypothetical protein JJ897_19070 [Marinibacterium sp.]|nr:hypothetical protein [Marinibacterium sp.]